MKKLYVLFISILALCFTLPVNAATTMYGRTALTGGTASVDNIPSAGLIEGDLCLVITSGKVQFYYRYNATNSDAGNGTTIIDPDDNGAADGRWERVDFSGDATSVGNVLTIADGVTVDNWTMGASAGTTPAANDNDTSLATTQYVQTEQTAYASDTATFTNKTYDGAGTGNVHTHEDGTAPTVSSAGQAKIDTTDNQWLYYGSALAVIHPTHTECVVVENLAAADDNYEIWMANDPVTITGIGVHCRGTCTTGADITLEDRSGNALTHTTPTHSTTTGNTTFQSVTAANTLVAGEGLAFDVDNAVDPETDEYTICFTYIYDRQ